MSSVSIRRHTLTTYAVGCQNMSWKSTSASSSTIIQSTLLDEILVQTRSDASREAYLLHQPGWRALDNLRLRLWFSGYRHPVFYRCCHLELHEWWCSRSSYYVESMRAQWRRQLQHAARQPLRSGAAEHSACRHATLRYGLLLLRFTTLHLQSTTAIAWLYDISFSTEFQDRYTQRFTATNTAAVLVDDGLLHVHPLDQAAVSKIYDGLQAAHRVLR